MMYNLKDEPQELLLVATMLMAMYEEVSPDTMSQDIHDYVMYLETYTHAYFDHRGFILVKDITPKLLTGMTTLWDGEAVYILPEYRKTRALREYYNFLFDTFQGDVIGMVHPDSEHNSVVSKRGELVGTVYKVNNMRSK